MTSSTKALRKFGLTVGLGFAVIGALSWARGHTAAPRVLWALAVLLLVPAAVAPAALAPVERVWMRFATVLGHVNTRMILTVVFYALLTPIGFVLRRFHDPLDRSLRTAVRATGSAVRRARRPRTLRAAVLRADAR